MKFKMDCYYNHMRHQPLHFAVWDVLIRILAGVNVEGVQMNVVFLLPKASIFCEKINYYDPESEWWMTKINIFYLNSNLRPNESGASALPLCYPWVVALHVNKDNKQFQQFPFVWRKFHIFSGYKGFKSTLINWRDVRTGWNWLGNVVLLLLTCAHAMFSVSLACSATMCNWIPNLQFTTLFVFAFQTIYIYHLWNSKSAAHSHRRGVK